MTYDELLIEAHENRLEVRELLLSANKGLIIQNRIGIKKDLDSKKDKACVLAEELGHYYTTDGDILDQTKQENVRQEFKARIWSYNKMIGLIGIVNAFNAGCINYFEMAEYLDVTEEFLLEALNYYKSKYGLYTKLDNYILYFHPSLSVVKLF